MQIRDSPQKHGCECRKATEDLSKTIFHGWYVVAACFLCMMISAGIAWFTFPVFVVPLQDEFGWTATELGVGIALWAAVGGIFSPILGRLLDRFGARLIMLAGIFFGGLCLIGLAEMQSLKHLYAILFFTAICTAASAYLPVASLISKWFVKKRGMAMGIAMMGMGVGGTIVPIVSNFLIQSVGWRGAYRIFGVSLWVTLIPVIVLWVRGSPSELGLKPDGDNGEKTDGEPDSDDPVAEPTGGFTARQALTLRSFWELGVADVMNAIPVVGIGVFIVAYSIESGIDKSVATYAYSSISFAGILGVLAAGAAASRFNTKIMLSISYGLPALAVPLLFGLKSPAPLFAFALLAGVTGGARAALWPLVIGDCFGTRAHATIMGFLMIFYQAGTIIGPLLAGRIIDKTESYHWLFVVGIAAYAVSGIFMALGTMRKTTES